MMMTQPIDGSGNVAARPGSSNAPAQARQNAPAPSTESTAQAAPRSEIDESAVKVEIQGLERSRQQQPQQPQQQADTVDEGPSSQERAMKRVRDMVDRIQQRVTTVNFQIEQGSNEVIVKVVNKETGETVRQLPPEEVQRLRDSLTEFKGHLVEEVS